MHQSAEGKPRPIFKVDANNIVLDARCRCRDCAIRVFEAVSANIAIADQVKREEGLSI